MTDDDDLREAAYCAQCYAELPSPSEEWVCSRCGQGMEKIGDWLSTAQYNAKVADTERQMNDWKKQFYRE